MMLVHLLCCRHGGSSSSDSRTWSDKHSDCCEKCTDGRVSCAADWRGSSHTAEGKYLSHSPWSRRRRRRKEKMELAAVG